MSYAIEINRIPEVEAAREQLASLAECGDETEALHAAKSALVKAVMSAAEEGTVAAFFFSESEGSLTLACKKDEGFNILPEELCSLSPAFLSARFALENSIDPEDAVFLEVLDGWAEEAESLAFLMEEMRG